MRLETARLLLRDFHEDDAPVLLRLLNSAEFLRFIGDRGVRTLDDARQYAADVLARYDRNGFGLLLVETVRGAPIGMAGLMLREWLDAPDLAYALLPESAGKGYATEAAAAVLQHAHDSLGFARVLAIVVPDHAASIRVLEKLGFARDGSIQDPRDQRTLALYAHLKGGT